MKYTTVFVGMDVHKERFSLAFYTNEKEETEYAQRTEAHYSKVISYLEAMRFHYGNDVTFVCGYEAGCLGYTLYHQLTSHHVKCVILAPTSMPTQKGKKKVKTDKRDAQKICQFCKSLVTTLSFEIISLLSLAKNLVWLTADAFRRSPF